MSAQVRQSAAAEHLTRVDRSLKIAKSLGFTLKETALFLGYLEDVGDNPEYLRRELQLSDDPQLRLRFDCIEGINAVFNKMGYTDSWSRIDWITNRKFEELGGDTMQPLLVSGDIAKVEYVLDLLQRIST